MRFLALLALLAAPAVAQPVQVLDTVVLTEATHPDLPLREVSAMAWQDGVLLAVSDRNRLYRLTLGDDPGRLAPVLVSTLRLADEAGERLRRRDFAAEGIALAGPALAILSEAPPQLALFDPQGRRVRVAHLAPDLADLSTLRDLRSGVEALADHPDLGLLVAPEEPLQGQRRRTHVIYGEGGPLLAFHTDAEGRTRIKAMETLPDGRILVLERDRLDDGTIQPFLRLIDPATCPVTAPCTVAAWPLALPTPSDADFEGLAWLGDGRLLIASDDRTEQGPRTVLALLSLSLD